MFIINQYINRTNITTTKYYSNSISSPNYTIYSQLIIGIILVLYGSVLSGQFIIKETSYIKTIGTVTEKEKRENITKTTFQYIVDGKQYLYKSNDSRYQLKIGDKMSFKYNKKKPEDLRKINEHENIIKLIIGIIIVIIGLFKIKKGIRLYNRKKELNIQPDLQENGLYSNYQINGNDVINKQHVDNSKEITTVVTNNNGKINKIIIKNNGEANNENKNNIDQV